MKKNTLYTILFTLLFVLTPILVSASGDHDKNNLRKTGILLVAFGSSEQSAWVSFETIEKCTKSAYPDIPIRWAFTSHIIRNKLAKQGKLLDSPETALAKMLDDKFTHVVIQSLHTIPGAEFHDLIHTVESFKIMGKFENIVVGDPLLSTQEDFNKTVDAVMGIIPKARKINEAVVLMGHGTHHSANAFYSALMFQLQLKDQNILVGTVEAYPNIQIITKILINKKIKKAYLIPFMSVAGDHAKNDMAGDENDSWKSVLTAAGIDTICILKGTAEYRSFADIWINHIEKSLSHFN